MEYLYRKVKYKVGSISRVEDRVRKMPLWIWIWISFFFLRLRLGVQTFGPTAKAIFNLDTAEGSSTANLNNWWHFHSKHCYCQVSRNKLSMQIITQPQKREVPWEWYLKFGWVESVLSCRAVRALAGSVLWSIIDAALTQSPEYKLIVL